MRRPYIDPKVSRAIRILWAGAGFGVGGASLGFVILLPIIGPSAASDAVPCLCFVIGVIGLLVSARYLR
jgi:hypothetical protein